MKIKEKPEDFVVEEIIDLPELTEGEYTYFWLTKKNWTTVRAIQQIAKRCGVSIKRFKFAGTKDKFAITKQLVSVWKVEPPKLERVNLADIDIEVIGRCDERVSLGDLKGNKFAIMIRDLSKKELEAVRERKEIVSGGFPNYFGEQRFGRGNTHLVGKSILSGDLEGAVKLILAKVSEGELEETKKFRELCANNWGDWSVLLKEVPKYLGIESSLLNYLIKNKTDFGGALRKLPKKIRKLYVHAYQSYLFNKALSEYIKRKYESECLDFFDFELCFPKEMVFEEIDLEVPGCSTFFGTSEFDIILKDLLKEDGIDLSDFECKRMPELRSEGVKRKGFIKPDDFSIKDMDGDLRVSFYLTKGAYATILIRSLFLG